MSATDAMHPVEDRESWTLYLERLNQAVLMSEENIHAEEEEETTSTALPSTRRLKHHHKKHHHHHEKSPKEVEREAEKEFWEDQQKAEEKARKKQLKKMKKRDKKMHKLYADPGISPSTEHGMIIDAGSTGSRLHLYEWDARVLRDAKDVQEAVSGRKISFPGTESRWTERLRPGIAEFAEYDGEELESTLADYLEPLINFAKTVSFLDVCNLTIV